MAQDGPKLAQDGPKLAQDRAKMGQDGRKMAQDTEDELQDAAQDRQDAISEGCPERLIKKNPGRGPWRVRQGSVEGPVRRDARPCFRLRLRGVCRIGQSLAVVWHALLPSARGRRIQARRAGPGRRPKGDILNAFGEELKRKPEKGHPSHTCGGVS